MTILHNIILSIVEGITEFLPISSTGHLILASKVLDIVQSDFVKSFEIIIQLGAILSVIVLYFKKLFNVETIKRLIVAFLPTAVIGLAMYKIVKKFLLGNLTVVVWSLLIGGVLLIVLELWYKRQKHDISEIDSEIVLPNYKQSFLIGLVQSVAIIPGVSRSGATIAGGLLMRMSRKSIVEFSFLLAVPTMVAASGLDILKNYQVFTASNIWSLVVGFVSSFIVAILGIKLLLGFIRKYDFIPFGVYRIVIALIFILFFLV